MPDYRVSTEPGMATCVCGLTLLLSLLRFSHFVIELGEILF